MGAFPKMGRVVHWRLVGFAAPLAPFSPLRPLRDREACLGWPSGVAYGSPLAHPNGRSSTRPDEEGGSSRLDAARGVKSLVYGRSVGSFRLRKQRHSNVRNKACMISIWYSVRMRWLRPPRSCLPFEKVSCLGCNWI